MSRPRFGIRARLTAAVMIVFTAVTAIGALVAVGYLHSRLVTGARADATAVLTNYTAGISEGGAVVTTIDSSNPGVFFYLDSSGNEISQYEYVHAVATAVPAGTGSVGVSAGDVPSDLRFSSGGRVLDLSASGSGTGGSLSLDQAEAGTITVAVNAEPVGTIHTVARGADAVAVAQRIRLPDGVELEIGVSTSLQPVADSIHAIKAALWLAIPVLALAVGLLTWFTVGRTLRPVHSITRRTRSITDANLSERVPVPESRDDIAELATTVNEMLMRLDHAQRRQRQFVADASHELRSPIAASVTQLEVAVAHPAETDWKATAAAVLSEQNQLGHLVDDLLALSRLDEQGVGKVVPVDLGELVAEEAARPHAVPVQPTISPDVVVTGNRGHLARAIRNVIDNACEHARNGVAVIATVADGHATIQVDDDGVGVPSDQRARIFDRFARLDEPRNRDNGGAGLGLAIVNEVVTAHGGTVSCTDAPSGGARITLVLPPPADPAPGDPPARPVPAPARTRAPG